LNAIQALSQLSYGPTQDAGVATIASEGATIRSLPARYNAASLADTVGLPYDFTSALQAMTVGRKPCITMYAFRSKGLTAITLVN
jgi:hypothetical protein